MDYGLIVLIRTVLARGASLIKKINKYGNCFGSINLALIKQN